MKRGRKVKIMPLALVISVAAALFCAFEAAKKRKK